MGAYHLLTLRSQINLLKKNIRKLKTFVCSQYGREYKDLRLKKLRSATDHGTSSIWSWGAGSPQFGSGSGLRRLWWRSGPPAPTPSEGALWWWREVSVVVTGGYCGGDGRLVWWWRQVSVVIVWWWSLSRLSVDCHWINVVVTGLVSWWCMINVVVGQD